MRMRRRLSPAALRRLGSDANPTQATHPTYTPEGVMIGDPGCGVGGVGRRPDEGTRYFDRCNTRMHTLPALTASAMASRG